MNTITGQQPRDTVARLMEAINQGDVGAALALYEPDAVFMEEPGKPARGAQAIQAALEGFIALKPTLIGETDQTIERGDVALFYSKWRLTGTAPDGSSVQMGGTSSDILRRQADGRWLITIDNPWGAAIFR